MKEEALIQINHTLSILRLNLSNDFAVNTLITKFKILSEHLNEDLNTDIEQVCSLLESIQKEADEFIAK